LQTLLLVTHGLSTVAGADHAAPPTSSIYPLLPDERSELERFLSLLASAEEDPKARDVRRAASRIHERTRTVILSAQHTVRGYDAWKSVFDEN